MWYKGELQRTTKRPLKMQEYLNKIKEIANNLELAGCSLSATNLNNQILCGFDHDYTPILVQLNDKPYSTWVEFQTTLLAFESRLDQINSFHNMTINIASANITMSYSKKAGNTNSSNSNRGNWKGANHRGRRARGRGGKFNNSMPICQIYGKSDHVVSLRFYSMNQSYMGSPPYQSKNQSPYIAYNTTVDTVGDPSWYVDSGASHHITNNLNNLQQAKRYTGKENLIVRNGDRLHITLEVLLLPHHLKLSYLKTSFTHPN